MFGEPTLWTYTLYIIYKYLGCKPERSELTFQELADFIFGTLWQKQHLVFHDGKSDLRQDLRYINQLGMIQLDDNEDFGRIKIKVADREKLKSVANTIEQSANLTGVELFNDYAQRIDKALHCEVTA
jgi:hypothetical protein